MDESHCPPLPTHMHQWLFFLEVLAQRIAQTSGLLALLLVRKPVCELLNESLLTAVKSQDGQQEVYDVSTQVMACQSDRTA